MAWLPDCYIYRTHFEYSLGLTLSGYSFWNENGKITHIGPGQVRFLSPQQEGAMYADRNDPASFWVLSFDGEGADRLVDQTFPSRTTVLQVPNPERLAQHFLQMMSIAMHEEPASRPMVHLLLRLILVELTNATESEPSLNRRSWTRFIACRQYMEQNYASIASIQGVADACHMDVTHLIRLFKTYAQKTPFQWLTHYRMQVARDLLQNSDACLDDIASQVGYCNGFAFSKAYKRTTGQPPSSVRGT